MKWRSVREHRQPGFIFHLPDRCCCMDFPLLLVFYCCQFGGDYSVCICVRQGRCWRRGGPRRSCRGECLHTLMNLTNSDFTGKKQKAKKKNKKQCIQPNKRLVLSQRNSVKNVIVWLRLNKHNSILVSKCSLQFNLFSASANCFADFCRHHSACLQPKSGR